MKLKTAENKEKLFQTIVVAVFIEIIEYEAFSLFFFFYGVERGERKWGRIWS